MHTLTIRWINDDYAELLLDGEALQEVTYDDLGSEGMRIVIATATQLSERLGATVITDGVPGR
jgi:hypothetical protein